MNELLQFVVRHGYMLVFAWVFVEQAGLPVPSAPLLLAAGALSGMHQMNLGLAVALRRSLRWPATRCGTNSDGEKAFASFNCFAGFRLNPTPAFAGRR